MHLQAGAGFFKAVWRVAARRRTLCTSKPKQLICCFAVEVCLVPNVTTERVTSMHDLHCRSALDLVNSCAGG